VGVSLSAWRRDGGSAIEFLIRLSFILQLGGCFLLSLPPTRHEMVTFGGNSRHFDEAAFLEAKKL
jgi:hypothetical protein